MQNSTLTLSEHLQGESSHQKLFSEL